MKKIVIASLPKSGTHFINLTVQGLGYRRDRPDETPPPAPPPEGVYYLDHYLHGEWAHRLRNQGAAVIAMVRDPRAIVVSLAHHALRKPTPSMTAWLEGETDPQEAQRRLFVKAMGNVQKWDAWVRSGLPFLRFEDIVGAAGGGSQAAQNKAAARIGHWLGVDPERAKQALEQSFNSTIPLFRKGQAHGWREELTADLRERIEDEQRDLLLRWGYKPD